MPDVTIVIKTIAEGDKDTRRAIGSFTELKSAIDLVSQGMQAAKKIYDETIGVTLKYAEEVRNLSLATGAGAQESSRFLQVMDDFQVSAGDVTAGMRAMKEKGLVPTIDTLAQLSDQFLAIEDPAKRLQFAQDNLGRSSAKYLNVLSKGGDAIRDMSAGVEENLILTDRQIEQTERYRLKIDETQDTLMGFKVAATLAFFDAADAHQSAANALLVYTGNLTEANLILRGHTGRVQEVIDETARATQYGLAWESALKDQTEAVTGTTESLEELTTATTEVNAANQEMLGLIRNLQSETDNYRETASGLHEQQEALRQDYVDGGVNAEEYAAQMGELTDAVKANEEAHRQAGRETMFNLVAQQKAIGGLSEVETRQLEKMGVAWNIFDQQTVDAAHSMMGTAGIMNEQLGDISDKFKDPLAKMTTANEKLHALQNMAGQMWTYYVNIETSGSFPNLPGISGNGAGGQAGLGQAPPRFATGGSFIIPPQYGYEGFGMGGIASASAGELVTITPRGQQGAAGGVVINIETVHVYANNAYDFMASLQSEL